MVDTTWIKGPIYGVRAMIAESAAFRTAVGATNVAEAKAVIYPWQAYNDDYDEDNDAQPIPRVILRYEDVSASQRSTTGFGTSYCVVAEFEFEPTSANDQAAAESFLTTIQTIVNEMLAVEPVAGYAVIEDMECAPSVQISDPDENNPGQRFIWYGIKFKKGMK